jgi:hypothetical protein
MSLKFTLQGIIQIGNVVGVLTGCIGEPEAVGPGISVEIGQGQVLPDVWVMSEREPKDAEQIDEISNG